MSYMDEYNKLKKKRLGEETKSSAKETKSGMSSYLSEYNKLKAQRSSESISDSRRENLLNSLSTGSRLFGDSSSDLLVKKLLNAEEKETEAKKEEKEEKEERKWYQKGHFEDGYNFGDIAKTILGVDRNKDSVSLTPAEKLESLYGVYSKEDFANKSGYVSTKAEGFWDKFGSKYGMGYNDLQYEYINNQNGIRDEIDAKAISFGSDTGKTSSSYKEKALDYMTDDEVAVYNYYYQTEGKDKAQEFLDALAETLSARKAGEDFQNAEGKTGREILYGAVAGNEQFKQGVKSLGKMIVGKDDYIPQTSTQILSGMIREDLAGDEDGFKVLGNSIAQVGFDILNTGTNMIPSIAVGAVNPAAGAALMGASAAGNSYQEALNEGHDKEGAKLYATTIGVLEGTLQYALGGIGKIGGTSKSITRAVSGIKNGALRFSLEYGGKIASEAVEEGLQEILDPIVKNAILDTDESINWEEVAYSALLGGVMGGVFGASEVSQSHLSANEQAVLDKVYKDAVAEKEKGGKLSSKEKNKIYDSVVKDMELGRIDTDTIESVLGGETYESYKSMTEQEISLKERQKTLQTEIEALQDSDNTIRNNRKLQEAEAEMEKVTEQLKGIDTKSAKLNLFSEVDKLTANDTKLRESYFEKEKRGKAFEADLTKYDAKQQETIKKAVESGILNNTRRTHEFVDLVAKISADKGVPFDFTNNQKLKESGFAIDGKQVNGFVTKDGVTLNVNSAKSLDTVVGHEITHVLEGTELYTELQTAIVEYAKSKGDYQGRYDTLTKLYENIEGANIDSELTAELVGDYIFTDTDFIHNLSTNNRNVFQKIYDEVKYMLKVATAGSKEARELERVKKLFDEAYRGATKNTADSGVKYSLVGRTADGSGIYKTNYPLNTPKAVKQADLIDIVQNVWSSKPINLKIVENGKYVDITAKFNPELTERSDLAKIAFGNKKGKAAEQRMTLDLASDLYQIAEESRFMYSNDAKPKPNNPAHDGVTKYHYFLTNLVYKDDAGNYIPSHMNIDVKRNGEGDWFYSFAIEKGSVPQALLAAGTDESATLPNADISQNDPNVKKQFSLSEMDAAPTGKFLGKDIALETAPIAETSTSTKETQEAIAPSTPVRTGDNLNVTHETESTGNYFTDMVNAFSQYDPDNPAKYEEAMKKAKEDAQNRKNPQTQEAKIDDYVPGESLEEQLAKADESVESLDTETESLFRDLSDQKITEAEFAEKWQELDKRYTQARQEQERLSAEMTDINNRKYESIDDSDIPPETEAPYYGDAESLAPVDPFAERDMNEVGKRNVKAYMYDNPEVKPFFQDAARGMLFDLQNGVKGERIFNEQMHYESGYEEGWMGTKRRTTSDIADLLDQWGYSYAQIENGLNAIIEDNGKENNAVSKRIEFMLDNRLRNGYKDVDGRPIPADEGYISLLQEKQIDDYRRESFDSFMEVADQYAPPVEEVAPVKDTAPVEDIAPLEIEPAIEGEQNVLDGFEKEKEPERLTRAKLHGQIIDGIKAEFNRKGLDLDEALKNAKRMNALSINDNTPQRVNDKTFGYEAGEALNELTFNRVAMRESNGIKWLNEQVNTIKKLSKKYNIKPRSKESAAAQMYAEGFWVNDKDEIIAYGDTELAQDFPDVRVQNRIKALASDPTIRKIYDDTLSAINEARARNAYPEIPRLENYYLHFRAMDDTFSRLGVPFNPNDIKAKDLPTDINGTTIDRKPGQPFFASSMHREGKRTSFDMFEGLEKYLNSAKNQIYHIDDIQTTRALWGYIADKYGQAHGLENLDQMEYEAQAEHIQQVYDGHLSNYARFLVEYGNHLAGKTALIDRGVEGLIGRRALQFINTVNMQTSRNQVGYSISSPLTNFIPSMEAIARTSKRDSIKAFAQTVSNVFRKDGFVENDLTLIRRRGTDKFAKTLWDKMSDPGFILMQTVDNVTSEFIVRTKYNELTRKGMDSAQAHVKAGEWASRIMGDRSLGQMPLHYNSKFMGLFTKYQLEVRNALDSQFYDTFQEVKASTKEIENQKAKNALTATKFAYRAVQIAALNHVFGMAFEKIAGYNPAFDIISTIATLFGWDDDEEDEDTFGDNAEQAFKELLGDLPYTSLFTDGGRIPIGSAMPIKQLVSGVDKYGNEKSRLETLAEAAPYYLLPGGYGQIKKTTQGLGMFSEEHPVSGSYTDSGNLRFPVEKTFGNVLKAGVFGQYASENARDYFDNERSPLKEKQIQEYIDVDIPIQDYWDYRGGLAKLKTNEEKVDYIDSLDLPLSKKNILVNNVLDRKEDVDLANYGEYGSLAEFDFAVKYPEKYQFFEEIGVTYDAYSTADDDAKDAYNWAFENPDKYTMAKAVSDDVVQYRSYTKGLSDIKADKDENGKSINGSRKEKVFNYIESLPIDYGQKCILFKSQYKADDSMNMDIIEYLDSREDIDYDEMVTILKELDFTVEGNNVYWD